MINSLPPVSFPRPSGGPDAAYQLSDEQRQGLNDILAQFDPDNLDSDSANKIVDQVKELDIRPSRAFFSAVFEAGFKPREIADLADLPGFERPPSTEDRVNEEGLVALAKELGDVAIRDASREQLAEAFKGLAEKGFDLSEPFVDRRF
ncbi:MAG: hypothetical protein AAGI89_10685 [Pseudomonadota bacterium]